MREAAAVPQRSVTDLPKAHLHLHITGSMRVTTVRDLGTEGAGDADVGLKQAINQGVIRGPRMVVTTRAMLVTGAKPSEVGHAIAAA